MKPNNGAIRISEQVGDDRKVEAVLREWGYSENVIQRLLAEEIVAHNSQRSEEPLSLPTIDVSSNSNGGNRSALNRI